MTLRLGSIRPMYTMARAMAFRMDNVAQNGGSWEVSQLFVIPGMPAGRRDAIASQTSKLKLTPYRLFLPTPDDRYRILCNSRLARQLCQPQLLHRPGRLRTQHRHRRRSPSIVPRIDRQHGRRMGRRFQGHVWWNVHCKQCAVRAEGGRIWKVSCFLGRKERVDPRCTKWTLTCLASPSALTY